MEVLPAGKVAFYPAVNKKKPHTQLRVDRDPALLFSIRACSLSKKREKRDVKRIPFG